MKGCIGRLKSADWLCLVVYFAIVTAMAFWFVGQENTFYWSDYNYYQIVTNVVREKIIKAPLSAIWEVPVLVFASTSLTHNLIFTLPLAAFELVFGNGRLQFILSLLYFYLTAYLFSLAALVSSVVSVAVGDDAWAARRKAFWTTVFAALLIPATWIPCLRGYPDMLPAAALSLAAYLYLTAKTWRHFALVGLLCALAPLLRRHFAYGSAALALVILVDQLRAPLKAGEKIKHLATTALTGTLFMASFGALFVINVLSCDYSTLYRSFAVPVVEALGYFGSTYGAIFTITACGGIVWACLDRFFVRRNVYFVAAFSILSMIVWTATQRQLGAHYTLYFDWFVISGNSFLFYQLSKIAGSKPLYRAFLGALAVLALVNFGLAFIPGAKTPFQSTRPGMLSRPLREGTPLSYLFSANYAPYVREDRAQIISLAKTLRGLTDGKGPDCLVLVNAQSDILDVDIVRNGERALGGESRIPMAEVPATDSRDSYPVEVLLHSRYVVTTEPDQTLLTPDRQKIILSVNRCFAQNWPISNAFHKLNQLFILDGGVKASIYERFRGNSPQEAASTLDLMADFIGFKPGSQPAWITSAVSTPVSYQPNVNAYKFKGDEKEKFLLSVLPLSSKNSSSSRPVRVSGKLISDDKTATAWIAREWVKGDFPPGFVGGILPPRMLIQSGKNFEVYCPVVPDPNTGRAHLVLLVEPGDAHKPFAVSGLKIEE